MSHALCHRALAFARMAFLAGAAALGTTFATAAAAQRAGEGRAPTIFSPGVISGPAEDASPAFTPDSGTVFFTRSNANRSVIMVSHGVRGHWSTPEIAPFSGVWRDLEPAMAPDGSYLLFISNRPTSSGGKPLDAFYNAAARPGAGGNLWRVNRTARGWGTPLRLPDIVNATTSIYSPSVAADGSVYFMQPTGREAKFHLFRAQAKGGTFEPPVAVAISAGEDYGDFDPAVAPDESFMVFSSTRPPAKVASLFITRRRNGRWTTPAYMGDSVSRGGAVEARLGPDHRTLYFSSRRVLDAPERTTRVETARALERIAAWDDDASNIWVVPLDQWLAGG